MGSVLFEINMLEEGNEKRLLLQSYQNAKKYIYQKDSKALKTVVSRLNGLYPVMSKKAQEISVMLVNEINKEADQE